MRTAPGDMNIEVSAARHHRPGPHCKFAQRQAWPVVHAEDGIARKLLEQAIGDHRARAADAFFGRLKNEIDDTIESARRGEVFGRTQQHGGVAVVPAGMHAPGVRGAVREGVRFHYRQGIHVGAQPDRAGAAA